MAANTINYTFPIYYDVNGEKTPFYNLVLRKVVVDSVVMSLGDKITGEVYYPTNSLIVTMQEYVVYKGVKYHLVSPPTILREGLVSDNSELKGMTKYSFTFYHPMYQLSNMPFTDVAVSADETKYLSQSGTFSWTGTGIDFIAKLNKNLQSTQWIVVANENDGKSMANLRSMPDEIAPTKAGQEQNSNVLSFDNVMISDALKTCYDTWKVPFVIDQIKEGEAHYSEGKRYLVLFGLPSNEIYETDGNGNVILDENDEPKAFVFKMGQGVGLKNNSRNPKNNKIITRIAGYGSTDNIQYGYPQIVWTGDQSWNYTYETGGTHIIIIDGEEVEAMSYPIYDGYINGQKVRLIQHPFTRDVLMPSIYRETVNKKVNPLAQDYDPRTELKDYYDALNETYRDKQGNWISFFNTINSQAPSYQKQVFDGIKPRIGDVAFVAVYAYQGIESISKADFQTFIELQIAASNNQKEIETLQQAYDWWNDGGMDSFSSYGGSYTFSCIYGSVVTYTGGIWRSIKYTSGGANFSFNVYDGSVEPSIAVDWDDTYDAEKDEYVQSYFKVKLPTLGFDLYACASVTQEMKINMRSGACQGCTFPVEVDWEDYKKNFYDKDGNFAPSGSQRNYNKYPDSTRQPIVVILKKEIETFGTLMPNIYQQPTANDKFVILGISLPQSYVTNAEALLDETMIQYMLENNVHYFDYPLKFDEHFLVTHQDILAQMRNNTIVRFEYPKDGLTNALYIKQMTIKYGDTPLPQYDITLTDDVEIVLNQVGQVTDDVSRMRVQMNELQKYYGDEVIARINEKLSKVADDVAQGRITFQQGLDTIGNAFIHGNIGSPEYQNGLYTGRGWRIDNLGNAEMESLRVRSYLEIVELLVNRMQAQEGDTMFSDNDQIEKVDYAYIEYETQSGDNPMSLGLYELSEDGYTYVLTSDTTVIPNKTYYYQDGYILSLKEKWNGYITSQQVGNILKGTINTLAAQQAGISDVITTDVYYTSWMQVAEVGSSESSTLGVNQIRVVLYSDDYVDPVTGETHHEVPAGKNFPPCELMTVARWGNILNPDEQGITENEKKRRRALQSSFYISTSEGRIVKLTGVNTPILKNGNYGTTLGIVPDFVKNWSIANRLIDGRDYLYAQGVIVGDFIKVDIEGNPLINYVDKGEWQDNTEYLVNEYNEDTLQYETHEVWHNGALWRAKMHQPVVIGGVTTYYEPTDNNSAYWQKLMAGGDSTRQIYSYQNDAPVVPQGHDQDDGYLPANWSDTPLALGQEHKDVYISVRKKHDGTWGQWSTPVLFSHLAEDGTSISITGSALKHYNTWAAFESDATKIVGQTYLVDQNENGESRPYIVVWSQGATGSDANLNDAYIVQDDGQLYFANDDIAPWQPLGQIKGDKGDNGDSNATVFIYKRSAGQPADTDKPTDTLTYSFTNGSLSGNLNGWSAIIPQSDGNPCWVRQVFVSSDSPTVTIAPTSWSTANKYTEDGTSVSITNKSVTYQVSNSGTTPPTGTWVDNVPTVGQGQFLWTRTLVTYSDGNSTTSYAVSRNGVNGDKGDKGDKGDTGTSVSIQSTDVKYAVTQNSTQPSDSDFIYSTIPPLSLGDYLWSKEVIAFSDGNDIKSYSVSRIGTDGAKGDTGANGSSTHFAYATSADGSQNFSTTLFSGATYIGTYTDTTVEDSTDYRDYEWTKLKGEQGVQGEQGDDAVMYEIVFEKNIFVLNPNTNKVRVDVKGKAYKIEGETRTGVTLSSNNLTLRKVMDFTPEREVYLLPTFSQNTFTCNDETTYTAEKLLKAVLRINNTDVAIESTPLVTDGQTGERGKVGRFYYYSGFDWDASNENDTFVVNDAQVPYFSKAGSNGDKYYVFNRKETPSGGEMTMAQMAAETTVDGHIQWNNAPWEVMTNDFKYLITEAIFAQFAQFGSAIISGDWMMSTNGTINGVAYNNGASYNNSPAYTWFDPQYPNESVDTTHNVNGKTWTGYNFVPNYAVDLLTGATYQQNAHVEGNLYVKAFYTKQGSFIWKKVTEEGNPIRWLDLDNSSGQTYFLVGYQQHVLPDANSYEGLSLIIVFDIRAELICETDKDIRISSYNASQSSIEYISAFQATENLPYGEIITLYSFKGKWCVISQRGVLKAKLNVDRFEGAYNCRYLPDGKRVEN